MAAVATRFASGSLFPTAKAQQSLRIATPCMSYFAIFSPGEKRVAVISEDGKVRMYGLPDGELQRTWNVPGGAVNDLAFSTDGTLLFAGGFEGSALIWEVGGGKTELEYKFPLARRVRGAFSPEDRLLALAPDGGDPRILEWESRKEVTRLEVPITGATALAFSPDGRKIAAASGETMIRIFEAQTGKLLATNVDFLLETFALVFSNSRKHLFIGGADKTVSILDADTGRLLRSFPRDSGGTVNALRVSPNGRAVLAIYSNELDPDRPAPARVWDAGSGTVTRTWEPGEPPIGGTWTRENHCLVVSTTTTMLRIENLA